MDGDISFVFGQFFQVLFDHPFSKIQQIGNGGFEVFRKLLYVFQSRSIFWYSALKVKVSRS